MRSNKQSIKQKIQTKWKSKLQISSVGRSTGCRLADKKTQTNKNYLNISRLTFADLAKRQQSTPQSFALSIERQRLDPSLTIIIVIILNIIILIIVIILIIILKIITMTGLTSTSTTLGELLVPPQCLMPVDLLGEPLGVEMSGNGVISRII